jgi:hypothetical protein
MKARRKSNSVSPKGFGSFIVEPESFKACRGIITRNPFIRLKVQTAFYCLAQFSVSGELESEN